MSQTRIVILGGGFGGLCVAQRLLRKRFGERIAITIVDEHEESVYTPWLHEVAAGTVHASAVRDVEIDLVAVRGIRYRRATVLGIDRVARHVLCADDSTIPFDILVCALGSVSNDFDIPGVAAFTCDLKRAQDAMVIRERLADMLQRAAKGERQRMIIIGNGANGTEYAAEVASMVNIAVQKGVITKDSVTVILAGRAPEPLMMLPPWLRRRSIARLEAIGVECMNNVSLVSVSDGGVLLQPMKDGLYSGSSRHEAFDCCVVTLGVKMPDAVLGFGFAVNEHGRMLVDETLRIQGETAMFGLGDSVVIAGKTPDPQTAQAAVHQSKMVVRNIAAMIARRPLKPYRTKRFWSMIYTLGKGYAVGEIFGVPVWGYTIAILRRAIDAHYFFLATSWPDALRRMWRGFLTYAKEGNIHAEASHVDRT